MQHCASCGGYGIPVLTDFVGEVDLFYCVTCRDAAQALRLGYADAAIPPGRRTSWRRGAWA